MKTRCEHGFIVGLCEDRECSHYRARPGNKRADGRTYIHSEARQEVVLARVGREFSPFEFRGNSNDRAAQIQALRRLEEQGKIECQPAAVLVDGKWVNVYRKTQSDFTRNALTGS